MKKIRVLIIICCCVMAIILVLLFISKEDKPEDEGLVTYVEDYSIEKVESSSDFYTIENICQSYFQKILYMSNIEIYNLLDPNYIKEFNITEENVISKLATNFSNFENNNYNISIDTVIEKMLYIKNTNNIELYFVQGYIFDNLKHEKNPFNIAIEVDKQNKTFYILPKEYIEKHKYDNVKEGQKVDIEFKEIKSNLSYNKYSTITKDETEIISEYFNLYKNNILFDTECAFEMLNEEYRNKRFGTFDNFKQYVNDNIKTIYLSSIDKYLPSTENGYVQYVCIDQNQNYYIFKQYDLTNFDIILDTYTLDLPEFIEKYKNTDNKGKTALNIQKFFQAINCKDYNYAYNCLSDGFKNNYFSTVNEFKQYVQTNFYNINQLECEVFEEKSGLNTYKIKLINKDNQTESIEKTVVMQLNEGTSFEMSFNVL